MSQPCMNVCRYRSVAGCLRARTDIRIYFFASIFLRALRYPRARHPHSGVINPPQSIRHILAFRWRRPAHLFKPRPAGAQQRLIRLSCPAGPPRQSYCRQTTGNSGCSMLSPGFRRISGYGGEVVHGRVAKRASSPSQRDENPRRRDFRPSVDGAP